VFHPDIHASCKLKHTKLFRYLRKIIKKSILGQPVAFTDFFGYLVGEQLLIGVRNHVYVNQCVSPVELTDGRGEEGGGRGAKSYDREKNLAIYKSFNTP
jgi:hypothetical protein